MRRKNEKLETNKTARAAEDNLQQLGRRNLELRTQKTHLD